ncbi:MAG: hypothetical protein LBH50_04245 [Spirochaetaceae bacterium]|nr:hypothetical protein [Spirochaetaceae bacterium]
MKRMLASIFFMLEALACAGAQDEKAVIKIYPLEAEGTSQEDARLLETLIYSYFADRGNLMVMRLGGAADEPDALPDYFAKISLRSDGDGHIFEIVISDAASRELSRQAARYKSTKDIALNMHNIVNAAFELHGGPEEASEAPDAGLIDEEKILGLWSGDTGIKLVRILPHGRAFAFFTSGVNMMLSYKIENNTLIVGQVSPNNENFYYPLPLPIAKVLAKEAEPTRWEFMLYENDNILRGERTETTVEFEDYEKIVIRHNSVRKSEWSRMQR